MSNEPSSNLIDILGILNKIPHRYPMLLVDRIIDYELNERATALKNVTINEPHFTGHFPQKPIMPGVLIIEAMAQTSGILVVHSLGQAAEGKLVYFMSIDEAKFRKPVVPGDTLYIHVEKIKNRGLVWKFRCEAKVDNTICAEAILCAKLADG